MLHRLTWAAQLDHLTPTSRPGREPQPAQTGRVPTQWQKEGTASERDASWDRMAGRAPQPGLSNARLPTWNQLAPLILRAMTRGKASKPTQPKGIGDAAGTGVSDQPHSVGIKAHPAERIERGLLAIRLDSCVASPADRSEKCLRAGGAAEGQFGSQQAACRGRSRRQAPCRTHGRWMKHSAVVRGHPMGRVLYSDVIEMGP